MTEAVLPTETILGLPFYNGTLEQAVARTLEGGLVVAPAGPGLAVIDREPIYYRSLQDADIILVDSGFLAILWERRTGRSIHRISGLRYLKALLDAPNLPAANEQFWVMPTADEAGSNIAYLSQRGIELPVENQYIAPYYPGGGRVRDCELLEQIQKVRPKLIVLNVAGGKQEVLGAWLKLQLDYKPAIICTGAAIAFLTGRQANIPDWVDRLKLGWLQRIIFSPIRYFPRYFLARRLARLLHHYGESAPGA